MRSQLLIGAASSGSGKTTFTLGLLRALARKGLVVQPFKCGPDYIDTRHHQMAAGRASVNLDRFMMSEKHIEEVYRRYAFPADIAITEGVMGLFDGYDGKAGGLRNCGNRRNERSLSNYHGNRRCYLPYPFCQRRCPERAVRLRNSRRYPRSCN